MLYQAIRSISHPRPTWQLPDGVTRGMMDYAESEFVAGEYDADLALHPLFEFDERILEPLFQPPGVVADLGCGTGRALLPLVRRGLTGLAIDLSQPMLDVVREKADLEGLPVQCLRANLVELDCLADGGLDYAMCLFSTLGMIRGCENRRRVLGHVRRALKPGGLFVLHVHNYWYNLYDPGGPWWLLSNWWQSWFDREVEQGDKYFGYRGVPNVFLHVFTAGELAADLVAAGLAVRTWHALDATLGGELRWPWLLGSLRASGWIVICTPA